MQAIAVQRAGGEATRHAFVEPARQAVAAGFRQQLLDGVWGRDVFIDGRTVDVHVGRLRKALMRGTEADPIRTVRGAGYAFEDGSRGVA